MSSRYSRAGVAALALLVGPSLGCQPRTAPDIALTSPAVMSITPSEGLAGVAMFVTIQGARFDAGATVTVDGAAANATRVSETMITATFPAHASTGVVDVAVTNPDGQTGTLKAGYRYSLVTLTAGPSVAAAGAPLSVTWVAPGRIRPGIDGDWIGLFKVGDENKAYLWSQATTGVSGTFALSAPELPGEYEFRYLVDDDYVDIARSSVITVALPIYTVTPPLAVVVQPHP